MNYCLIPLSSITTAKRLEKECLSNGILCSIVGTPKGVSKNGCSNSLRVKENDLKKVIEISKSLKIYLTGAFKPIQNSRNNGYIRLEKYDDLF